MDLRRREGTKPPDGVKIKYQWIALDEIPELIKRAIVIAEDASFWIHKGIDWYEVKEALKKSVAEKRMIRGASSITQQVVKNLYLSPEKSINRKISEWLLAKRLEHQLSKKRILEIYLNIIEWGPGIYGIYAASDYYFHKKPSDLELYEIVCLAAVLPNPLLMKPDEMTRDLKWRVNVILDRLYYYNEISREEYDTVLLKLNREI